MTPRTDAVRFCPHAEDENTEVVEAEFARTLERELDALRKVLLYWRDECTLNEPSLSEFNRMVDEALTPNT